ncbi:MAG: 50S ribosome-binding GTPase [Chloroflexi bacterium]|nr:50S ribosome-binding GTPase [Chloroflexota bacterium]MBL7061808.1 50S ribosome-binding GTPase [Dehalococcoidia bacterium]
MPANLPPQYFDAEKRYRAAKTPEDKIEALEVMLAIMPKHKGTDHLHGDLRRRIAKLTEEAERKAATSRASFYIRKEGAGQVALIGLPNTGKSQLLAAVTDASPEIGAYPFTTRSPNIGMMKFENVQIQLVDTPPVTGKDSRVWLNNIGRNADRIAIIVDLSNNPVQQVEATLQELENIGIVPVSNNVTEATIGKRQRKMLIIANKSDLDNASASWSQLKSRYNDKLPMVSISAIESKNLDGLRKEIFQALEIIRVHTKTPGQKPDLTDPIILKKGSTVKEAAEDIHKDFKSKLKYAVVWGSGKFDGQRVSQEHVLQDNDIIELHI